MEEPFCCKCGKKYYENILEVADSNIKCVSCTDIPKDRGKNIFSRLYYRYRSEYGLTAVGEPESIIISKLNYN